MPVVAENASARLAQEVTKKVRDRGLVLWVDAERQYEAFVDALSRKDFGFEYPVISFRGSYLELILALEPFGNALYPEKALVHLSGLNKESVKEAPVYELYKAGTVFRKGPGDAGPRRSHRLGDAGRNRVVPTQPGTHAATFDNTLLLLKSALSLLRQAGVERFVIASDHGFLLQDAATESVPLGANMRVADRRHALLPSPSGAADVLELKLSTLEYDVEQDQYLVLRTFVNILDLLADDPDQDANQLLGFQPAELTPEEEAVMAGRKLDEPPPDDGFGGSSVSM